MKQYVICQMIGGHKYLAAYAETKQEAIEKAELLGVNVKMIMYIFTCLSMYKFNRFLY